MKKYKIVTEAVLSALEDQINVYAQEGYELEPGSLIVLQQVTGCAIVMSKEVGDARSTR